MFQNVQDPDLPTLAALTNDDLVRITGDAGARLLRARYQPGARAILHVALGAEQGADEGAIWLFAGDKAARLAKNLPAARHDPASGALFQVFPNDHRMPLLLEFVTRSMELAVPLMGGAAAKAPELLRYRPGLSATFRWQREDGRVFFVKQTPDGAVAQQALALRHLAEAAKTLPVSFSAVAGVLPDLRLIAYEAAEGVALDDRLFGADVADVTSAIGQVVGALQALWSLRVVPDRVLDRDLLLRRAEQACTIITLLDDAAGAMARGLQEGLAGRKVPVRLRPIHGDMKLEHAFLAGPKTTLIDTESLSLGDPDYDLAKLEARVRMAEVTGVIANRQAQAAILEIRKQAGPHYDWFLACARLQCAKFFAQRFDPKNIPLMRQVMVPC